VHVVLSEVVIRNMGKRAVDADDRAPPPELMRRMLDPRLHQRA